MLDSEARQITKSRTPTKWPVTRYGSHV